MNAIADAGTIVVQFVFGTLVSLLVLRVLLQLVRANFYNPVCQMLYRFSNPVLMPLQRVLPVWRRFDAAAVLVAWLLAALKFVLVFAFSGLALGVAGLALMALVDVISTALVLLLGAILLRVLMSFFSANRANPFVPLVYQLSEPLLAPIRRVLPPLGGMDFSPAVASLALWLLYAVVLRTLLEFGTIHALA